MADLQSALRSLEQFEVLMREIYNELCEAFSEDAEASALFSKLAFEESSHLGEVQFLRRLTRQNAAHFAEVELDLDHVARGAGVRRHDRDFPPRQLVDQRRLADIRRT